MAKSLFSPSWSSPSSGPPELALVRGSFKLLGGDCAGWLDSPLVLDDRAPLEKPELLHVRCPSLWWTGPLASAALASGLTSLTWKLRGTGRLCSVSSSSGVVSLGWKVIGIRLLILLVES